MPPIPGMVHWHHYLPRVAKTVKQALSKAAHTLDSKLQGLPLAKLEPVLVRNAPKQPLHPLARIRQNQSRWYSTVRRSVDGRVRQFTTAASGRASVKYDRASLPGGKISTRVSQSSGRAPFASGLRPNLTGGTLGRTAGGYTLGSGRMGGARHFSHAPTCQAQVVQNVSQAVRAFLIGGQKAHYDGVTPQGDKRYKAVTALQEETGRKIRNLPKVTPGSFVDFRINPTVTAFTPLAAMAGFEESSVSPAEHLNTDGLMDCLSADFGRVLQDLAATLNDLKRLSALGDLPITNEGQSLRVHFPGVDAETVERLCQELNVTRGIVVQDPAFDKSAGTEMALMFPFAPSEVASQDDDCASLFDIPVHSKRQSIDIQGLLTPSGTAAYSTQSARSDSDLEEIVPANSAQSARSDSDLEDVLAENPWLSSPSGYHSAYSPSGNSGYESDTRSLLEYQDSEGIYRFIDELDSVQRW